MSLQKLIFILSGLFLSVVSSTAGQLSINPSNASDSTKFDYVTPFQISIADSIINYGKLFLDTPYHYGSGGSSSFDCSGFTSYVFRNFGYSLQRSSASQAQQFDSVDRSELRMGDLVYFSGRARSSRVGHVGIVTKALENGQFEFIHAAVHSGVTISNSQESYYTKRFVKANRVIGIDRLLGVVPYMSKDEIPTTEPKTTIPFSSEVKQVRKYNPAKYHSVKSGETLSSIAHKYGISVSELKRSNDLKSNRINRRQRLKIRDEEIVVELEKAKTTANIPNEESKIAEKDNAGLVSAETNFHSPAATSHIIKKGESLFSISRFYNISVEELKKINNIKSGKIQPGQELILSQSIEPVRNLADSKSEIQQKTTTHKVIAGETLSGISKMYHVTITELKKMNDLSGNSLRPGQELKVNQTAAATVTESEKPVIEIKTITHKVKNGESLFTISKKYKVTVEDLKNINNLSGSNIQPGQEIKICQVHESEEKEPETPKHVETSKSITHKVTKGESLSTISKEFNVSIEALKEMNNLTDNKIHFGQELIINQTVPEKNKRTTTLADSKPKSFSHKVKSGESYYSIAKKYGCTMNDLKEWNNKSGSKLSIGDHVLVYTKAVK